ncbi:MAG TPA: hypothetical protein VFV00_17245 [Acidimicrobiales bacterium]|nr:hypothetical protein [Acidimicrobiales bacterium]
MARRLTRLVFGLLLCGTGVALMIDADLGLAPWDVLHQGVSIHTGIPIGTVAILVGIVVLLAWLPLHERYGVGTLLNVVFIGTTIDVLLAVLPDHPPIGVRVTFLLVGTFLFGPGSGFYIGAGMGPGPRDGLMTAIAARGHSIRVVRTILELSVLTVGFLLGGSVGIGTVLFAVTIGPNVHYWLDRLTLVHPEPETVIGAE